MRFQNKKYVKPPNPIYSEGVIRKIDVTGTSSETTVSASTVSVTAPIALPLVLASPSSGCKSCGGGSNSRGAGRDAGRDAGRGAGRDAVK